MSFVYRSSGAMGLAIIARVLGGTSDMAHRQSELGGAERPPRYTIS
jgi:hypothetical protein